MSWKLIIWLWIVALMAALGFRFASELFAAIQGSFALENSSYASMRNGLEMIAKAGGLFGALLAVFKLIDDFKSRK